MSWPQSVRLTPDVRRVSYIYENDAFIEGSVRAPRRTASAGSEAGQEFEVERVDRGEYRLVRRPRHPNEGVVDWLLACPEKDFFVPIESESTDTL